MKRLLTFLLSVLMCVCLVNINTNRIVKADGENTEPKQEEVLKEEIPEEKKEEEEVVTPEEEKKEEETPAEQEEKKEEEITPEEEKQIEEVIEEIKEDIKKEEELAKKKLTLTTSKINEETPTYSIYVDPTKSGDARIYYKNEDGQVVTPASPPSGIYFDADGNLVLEGFDFPTECSTGITIVGLGENDTLNIKLIGGNYLYVGNEQNENTRFGIKNEEGNIKFINDGTGDDDYLEITVQSLNKNNFGIYSKGSIISNVVNNKNPEMHGIIVQYYSPYNSAAQIGTQIGFMSGKNIELSGKHLVACDMSTYYSFGDTNISFYADGEIKITGAGANTLSVQASMVNGEGGQGNTIGYFNAGFIANKITVDSALLSNRLENVGYSFSLVSPDITFKGNPRVTLYSDNPNSLMSSKPTIENGINGIGRDYYTDKTILYSESNFKRYSSLEFAKDDVYSLTFKDAYNETVKDYAFKNYNFVELLYPSPLGEPYEFGGWYKDPGFVTKAGDAGEYYTFNDNDILYAKWTVNKPEISRISLGGGVVGKTFKQQLQIIGYDDTVKWQITSGSLPQGLTLHESTGIVDGTPTTKGDFTVTITALDANDKPVGDSRTFDMSIDDSTVIDFNKDPAKALMLLKQYDKNATYQEIYDGQFGTGHHCTLSIHNLNYVTDNGYGIILPTANVVSNISDADITIKVYGTNNIQANGYYDGLELGGYGMGVETKGSVGLLAGGRLEIVNGDPNTKAKLTVKAASNKNVIDMSVGGVAKSLYIDNVDCDFIGGESTMYSFGFFDTSTMYDSNESVENNVAIGNNITLNAANLNCVGSKTYTQGSSNSSIGLLTISGILLFNDSQLTAKGEDVAKYYNYRSGYFMNSVLTLEDEALDENDNDSLNRTHNNLSKYIAYGANTVDGEANTVLSDDSLSSDSHSQNFFMGDGNEVVKKLVLKNGKYNHALYFNKKDHKFYKDSLYKQVVSDFVEGEQYEYDDNSNVLTLNNFVFETSAKMGLIFDGNINIYSQEGSSNIIACEKYYGSNGIYASGNITIDGEGKLQVTAQSYGVIADDGKVTINGGTNRIVANIGIYSGGIKAGQVTIDGGDSYIYGTYPLMFNNGPEEGTLYIKDGLVNVDTNIFDYDSFYGFKFKVKIDENYENDTYYGYKLLGETALRVPLSDITYAGMSIINANYSDKLISAPNWLKTIKPVEKEFYRPIIFAKDTDGDFGWFKYEYTGQENDGFKPEDKLDIKEATYDEDDNVLTLNNFKDYKFYGSTGIMLPEGITLELKGNNKINLVPLSSDFVDNDDRLENAKLKLTPSGYSGISFYGSSKQVISTIKGDGNLEINVKDDNKAFQTMMASGISTGEFNLNTRSNFSNLLFNGTGTITTNVISNCIGMGIVANDVGITNAQKLNINTNAALYNVGILANTGIEIQDQDKGAASITIKSKNGMIANGGLLALKSIIVDTTKKTYLDITCDGGIISMGPKLSEDINLGTNSLSIAGQSSGILSAGNLVLVNTDTKIKITDSSCSNIIGIIYAGQLVVDKTSLDIQVGNCYRGSKIDLTKKLGVEGSAAGIYGMEAQAPAKVKASTIKVKVGNGNMSTLGVGVYNSIDILDKSTVDIVTGDGNMYVYGLHVRKPSLRVNRALSTNRLERNFRNALAEGIVTSSSGNAESYALLVDNSKLTVNTGNGPNVFGIYAPDNVNIINQSVVKTTAGDAESENNTTFSCGLLTTPLIQMNAQPKMAKVETGALQSTNVLTSPLNGVLLTNNEVGSTITIDDSELTAVAGKAKSTYAIANSVGIYAGDVDMKSGTLTSTATESNNSTIGLLAEGKFNFEDGTILFEVNRLKNSNENTKIAAFAATEVSDNMLAEGFVKYPSGGSIGQAEIIGNTYYTFLDKNGIPAEGASNKKTTPPSPKPDPGKKDESCEKVIGPTWHWNNTKGVCEEVGVVGTYTR